MTTLCYAPGTCAIGIHVLLEEVGKPYDIRKIDFPNRGQYQAEYTAINPKSKVPTLIRDDGSVLTEFPAIAVWLALSNPDRKLLKTDPEGMARTLEAVDYIVASLHMQGWTRFWRPVVFTENEADHPGVKGRGREIVEKGLALIDAQLAGKDWWMGDFSIADCALYYLEFWCNERVQWPMPPNIAAHYARMKTRPSVVASRRLEGVA